MDTFLPCTLYMVKIICTNFDAFITKWTIDTPIDWINWTIMNLYFVRLNALEIEDMCGVTSFLISKLVLKLKSNILIRKEFQFLICVHDYHYYIEQTVQ